MTHNPSSPSKLLVPESRTSNFANLSWTGIRFVWYQKLGQRRTCTIASQ